MIDGEDIYVPLDTTSLPKHRAAAVWHEQSRPVMVGLSRGQTVFKKAETPIEHSEILSSSKSSCFSQKFEPVSIGVCPRKPYVMSNHYFYVKNDDFMAIKESMDKLLSTWSDFEYAYFSSDCKWRCKMLIGSEAIEIEIGCFWDVEKSDHLIQLRRIKGFSKSVNCKLLMNRLKSELTDDDESSVESGRSSRASSTVSVTPDEYFASHVQMIREMAVSDFYESRLEAVKLLCDLPLDSDRFVSMPQYGPIIIDLIGKLLNDTFDDVSEFAINALLVASDISQLQEDIVHTIPILEHLLAQVGLSSEHNHYSFASVQRHRNAALVLSKLVRAFPENIYQALCSCGLDNSAYLKEFIPSISDIRTREYVSQLLSCYSC